jgi:hypothetical protein
MKLRTLTVCLISLIAAVGPSAMNADTPGRHRAYLHARTDLRTAQFFMRVHEEPNVTRNLDRASQEVEAAIGEIDRAAVLDRKDLMDRPRIDTHMDRRHRFENIVALLRSARADLAREEDNGRARGWRDDAYRHIDAALEHVHHAAVDMHWDRELGF